MILIGSRAAAYWDNESRRPNDIDLIGTLKEIHAWATRYNSKIDHMVPTSPWKMKCKMKSGLQVEFEIAEQNPSSQMLIDRQDEYKFPELTLLFKDFMCPLRVALPEVLYLIKRSHIYWPVHWQKTIEDMHALKAGSEQDIINAWDDFYQARLIENEAKFGKRFQANLNQSNDTFFAKSERAVKRQFEHDDLHEIVKYYDRPLYEEFKDDKSKAIMSFARFFNAGHEKQMQCIREEAMVIALERVIIPKRDGFLPGRALTPENAYRYALQRICTNLTSGWFRESAINNWPDLKDPDVDYVGMFEAARDKL